MAGLNLSRNTRLFVSTVKGVGDGSVGADALHTTADTFEIRVLDGYTFTQDSSTQEITLDEAGCTPVRGQKIFNTALNPVDFNFDTYIRPYDDATPDTRCVEEILWNALVTDTLVNPTLGASPMDADINRQIIDFTGSDKHSLLDLYLFFKLDNVVYRINGVKITSAEIDFSIDSIAKISWSGQGLDIDEVVVTIDEVTGNNNDWLAGTDYLAVPADASFIKNKLSSMSITDDDPAVVYNIPITGGSLTIENNVTFLTPEELAIVNKPIGSFTGTRAISGSVTAYLRTSAAGGETGDLYSNLIADTTTITHAMDVEIKVGTCAVTDAGPFVSLKMPQTHLVIPTINVEDVISTEIAFTALGTDLDQQDELTVTYVNVGDGVP